jgi:hypothetical protein
MVNAIDCGTKLTNVTASNLANKGVTHVGRYLAPESSWKSLLKPEVEAIKGAGLQIFSLFEKAATKVAYFTAAQGKSDALEAVKYAEALGQPHDSAIYFTVDYDAQSKDLDEILSYFQAVKANLKNYKLGAYGSYSVLNFLHSKGIVDYYFQTVAWSRGQHFSFNHIFQFHIDKPFAGINVDFVNLEQNDVGAWGKQQIKPQTASPKVIGTVKIDYPKNYGVNAYHSPNGAYKEKVPGGTAWKVYALKDDHYDIGQSTWVPKKYCIFKKS